MPSERSVLSDVESNGPDVAARDTSDGEDSGPTRLPRRRSTQLQKSYVIDLVSDEENFSDPKEINNNMVEAPPLPLPAGSRPPTHGRRTKKKLCMSHAEEKLNSAVRSSRPGVVPESRHMVASARTSSSAKRDRKPKRTSDDGEEDEYTIGSDGDFDVSEVEEEEDVATTSEDDIVDEVEVSEEEPAVATKSGKKSEQPKYKSPPSPCGLKIHPRDGDLPPISNLKDMFDDMVSRLPDVKGLFGSGGYRKLRVATMCSGTESPLLALGMISGSLKKFGLGHLEIDHVFSCEIEPFKQAYIERNFHPPILFRDIRELGGEYATTAYGAKVEVPGGVDILIAGTSCVDFSNLNNKQKDLGEKGESTDTFRGMMAWVKRHRPLIVIQENIKNAKWQVMRQEYLVHGYSAEYSIQMDTKKFYIPHTRQRGYLFAFDQKNSKVPNKWIDAIKKLERPATSTFENFMLPDDDPRVHRARLELAKEGASTKVVEWERCEVRHHRERLRQGLGQRKPLTLWEQGGVCSMLDYMWQDWGKKQVHRVLDLMDINFLIAAKTGQDATYKAGFWNLSQNVDRNTMGSTTGICPCLTPTMVPYLPYRGGPMVGYETLHMQGLPIDQLLLTKETSGNLQNLAGNAMSSTVVGAAMLAALILSEDNLRPADDDKVVLDAGDGLTSPIVGDDQLKQQSLDLSTTKPLEIESLLANAKRSARMCICEGRTGMTSNQLRVCQECGFSSCEECGRRPLHDYALFTGKEDRLLPLAFEEQVKRVLPMILQLSNVTGDGLKSLETLYPVLFKDINAKDWGLWCELMLAAGTGEFRFKKLIRKHIWTAIYESPHANMELVLDSFQPQWRIFAKCPDSEGLNSRKRALCRFPIARMVLDRGSKDAFNGAWEVSLPSVSEFNMAIEGSGDIVDCWEKKLGLTETPFQKSVFSHLTIGVPESEKSKLDIDISGKYKLIDECGTACGALHRKLDGNKDEPPLYFFLEQERISPDGKNARDSFVFSTTHHRLAFGEERPLIARLPPKWRQNGSKKHEKVSCTVTGHWVSMDRVRLAPPVRKNNEGTLAIPGSSGLKFSATDGDCKAAAAVISVRVPLRGQMESVWTESWTEVDQVHERAIFQSLSWLTERIRSLSQLADWRFLPLPEDLCRCERCAPKPPGLKWELDKNKFKAVEDHEQAAPYERAVKNRPKPIVAHLRLDSDGFGNLKLGLNVPALVHRALAALPGVESAATPKVSWRLITDYIPVLHLVLPPFNLLSNKNDRPHKQPPNFRVNLRPEQLRSLTWMLAQEGEDVKPFIEEEISEAVLPELNWRLEGRAERPNLIKGGVLADQVGYGKTAITVGLIDTLQEQVQPAKNMDGYIPIKATLIIVPAQLCNQWPSEISKFTGNQYNTLVIKNVQNMKAFSIMDIQKADIIVVAATLLKSDTYQKINAAFGGETEPPANEGRRFLDWQRKALKALRKQVNRLRDEGSPAVWECLQEAWAKNEEERASGRQIFKQKKRAIGAAYVQEMEEREKAGKKRKRSTSASDEEVDDEEFDESEGLGTDRSKKTKAANVLRDMWGLKDKIVRIDWRKLKSPTLDMFYFNRVVVDEFTYYKGQVHAGITSLKGDSRWVLSGTPPLGDFADVKTIALMLDVHLGIDDDMVGTDKNRKLIDRERTSVEKFTAFNDVRSPQWHTRRHEIAQVFMNQFLRQNIAEIEEIEYVEHVVPVVLPPAERAIYLELEHYLRALDYQMRRARTKVDNDRDRRLQESLGSSNTADEALIKRCSHFDLELNRKDEENAVKACDVIVRERKAQLGNCREEIRRKLRDTVKLHREIPANRHVPRDLWLEFVEVVRKDGFGDADANVDIRALVSEALAKGNRPSVVYSDGSEAKAKISEPILPITRKPILKKDKGGKLLSKKQEKEENLKAVAEFWPEDMDEKLERLRAWTTALRTLCNKELAPRHRSLRYFTRVRDLQRDVLASAAERGGITDFPCNGTCGKENINVSEFAILSTCGHHGCKECVEAAAWKEQCIAPGCKAAARPAAIVMGDTLGCEDPEDGKGRQHGKKLEMVVDLIKKVIPKDEKILLFVQFQDLMEKVSQIFQEKGVSFDRIEGTASMRSNRLSAFQEANVQRGGTKVLLLNVMDESAAGANLTCANHVILLSPLLTETDYTYQSSETQAIGRVRRYGQERKVHVWRFLSTDTKDVEILEQRSYKGEKNAWKELIYQL